MKRSKPYIQDVPDPVRKPQPILFSGPMIRAILDGRKTMTRRVMRCQPSEDWIPTHYTEIHKMENGEPNPNKVIGWGPCNSDGDEGYPCPYGQVGDRLWVRETHYRFGQWRKDGLTKSRKQRWIFIGSDDPVAHFSIPETMVPTSRSEIGWHKRPSIFMPRWASRITLEITSVRVERLQDITHADVCAEGFKMQGVVKGWDQVFARSWDALNAKRKGGIYAWAKNPWVWMIEFKRI